MKSRKPLTMVLAALFIALTLPAAAMAETAVSVECAYNNPTSTDLVCEVWVNTTETLRSGGVSGELRFHQTLQRISGQSFGLEIHRDRRPDRRLSLHGSGGGSGNGPFHRRHAGHR